MMSAPLAHGMLAGLDEIAEVGRDRRRGGYSRHLWQGVDLELRAWFIERAERIGLDVETDRNGNIWAWWGTRGTDAVVTGSHLDSVPGGGAYDGPLGVVSALNAVESLIASGFRKERPCAILVFAEEEGSRFGISCLGSKLMTGEIDPATVRSLTDRDGISFTEAAIHAGTTAEAIGVDHENLDRIGVFIETHVEQGRGLIDLGSPVALAASIMPHGRWRIEISGQGNHAGATVMGDRRDPMIAAARVVLAIQDAASNQDGARATVGRLELVPGGTNVIASTVNVWLDARSLTDEANHDLVAEIAVRVAEVAALNGCVATVTEESWAASVAFDPELRLGLSSRLGGVPELPSGAGHDAGILASAVPSAMLFVRNPTGISHSPEEFASADDCVEGVAALESILRSLLAPVAI